MEPKIEGLPDLTLRPQSLAQSKTPSQFAKYIKLIMLNFLGRAIDLSINSPNQSQHLTVKTRKKEK